MFKKTLITLLISLVFIGCKQPKETIESEKNTTTFHYAKNISIDENETTITIQSSGNSVTFDKKDLPIQTVMVETTSAIAYLNELGLLNKIKGATDVDFIYNPKILEGINNQSILKIGT